MCLTSEAGPNVCDCQKLLVLTNCLSFLSISRCLSLCLAEILLGPFISTIQFNGPQRTTHEAQRRDMIRPQEEYPTPIDDGIKSDLVRPIRYAAG